MQSFGQYPLKTRFPFECTSAVMVGKRTFSMLLQLLCIKDSSTHFEFEVLILISRVGEARGKSKKVLTKIHPVRKRLIKARIK